MGGRVGEKRPALGLLFFSLESAQAAGGGWSGGTSVPLILPVPSSLPTLELGRIFSHLVNMLGLGVYAHLTCTSHD